MLEPRVSGENAKSTSRAGRRAAVLFALSFLIVAFVLLATFRFAIGSRPMNAYLFAVAQHTAAVLSMAGDSCEVETPESYSGREALVRASLDTWRRGEDAVQSTKALDTAQPLSSWEAWQYRAGQLEADIEAHRKALKALEPPPPREVFNREEHVAVVRSRLEQLEAVLPTSEGFVKTQLAKPGLAEFVRVSRGELDGLARDASPDTQTFAARVSTLAANIETWRVEERAFVNGRLDNLEAQQRERGPRVDFCYRAGTDAGDNAAPSADIRFSFELVPDCGALPVMSIYMAAVLAFPAMWRRRFMGVVLGLPVLYVVNVARLSSLAVLGAWDHGGKWYQFCHEYVWQGVYIGCVVITWLLWLELVVKRHGKARKTPDEDGEERAA